MLLRRDSHVEYKLVLCQQTFVGRDSEIAPTESVYCRRELRFPTTFKIHQLTLDGALGHNYNIKS